MQDEPKVRRIFQVKMRMPSAESTQLLALMKASAPFYEAWGATRFRILRNVDDPAQLVVIMDYQAPEALELNRQKLASDPAVRNMIQGWRALTAGAIEMDVYEDVTDTV